MSVAKCFAELTNDFVQKVAVSHGVRPGVSSRAEPKMRFAGAPDQSSATIAIRPARGRAAATPRPERVDRPSAGIGHGPATRVVALGNGEAVAIHPGEPLVL